MKILTLVMLALATLAYGNDVLEPMKAPDGEPGVTDGSCWSDDEGATVRVDVDNQPGPVCDVTFSNENGNDTVRGTDDPDGGCADSVSGDISGDGDHVDYYRVEDGGVQHRVFGQQGWTDLERVPCD